MVTRSSTHPGSRFDLFGVTMFPDTEKTLSDLALLAGMPKIDLATVDRMGRVFE